MSNLRGNKKIKIFNHSIKFFLNLIFYFMQAMACKTIAEKLKNFILKKASKKSELCLPYMLIVYDRK